jgi:hypothetical protein
MRKTFYVSATPKTTPDTPETRSASITQIALFYTSSIPKAKYITIHKESIMLNTTALDNVVDIVPTDTTDKRDPFFEVERVPLEDCVSNLIDCNDLYAIRRKDSGDILHVAKKSYRLVPHADAVDVVEKAIAKAKIDTEGVEIKDYLSYKGAHFRRDYIFPNHIVEPNVGDITMFKVSVLNSIDGSTSLSANCAGHRLWCKNGMTMPEAAASYRSKHTSGLDLKHMASRLVSGMTLFHEQEGKWREWQNTPVSLAQGDAFIETLDFLTVTQKESIKGYWAREAINLGMTKWALYNALTYYSSHHKITRYKENEGAIITNRENSITRAVGAMNHLEAA